MKILTRLFNFKLRHYPQSHFPVLIARLAENIRGIAAARSSLSYRARLNRLLDDPTHRDLAKTALKRSGLDHGG
jgi:hypothetical protein